MKELLYILLTFHISLFTFDVISQPSITWQKYYDNNTAYDNEANDICISLPGSYFLVGRSYSGPNASEIVRINDYGDTIWNKYYSSIIHINTCASDSIGNCFSKREEYRVL